ncbi:MAG: hypothetical protein IT449_14000 [Phycisphaerales bacterium]|nr:hypothetical protein [Phycisphaerales bacterium]
MSVQRGTRNARCSARFLRLFPSVIPVIAAWVAFTVPLPLRADQLEIAGKRYPRGKVIGIESGELRFRAEDSTMVAVPLADVVRIYIDPIGEFADFNAAEQFVADGAPDKAIARYERQLRTGDEFWPDLIRVRLLRACDLAGQIDKAVTYYLRVLEGEFTGPVVAARVMPDRIPGQATSLVKQAVDQLERSATRNESDERRPLLLLLKYDILRRTGDARAAAMAPIIAELPVPAKLSSPRTGAIQLEAIRAATKGRSPAEAIKWLDRVISQGDDAIMPDLLLLKGGAQLESATTRDEFVRAGWTFMRVVAHYPGDSRAADALLSAAEVHERIHRKDKAKALLEECIKHPAVRAETRAAAERKLAALPG